MTLVRIEDYFSQQYLDWNAKKLLVHLPIIILASLPFTDVADSMPKFDITRECRSEGGTREVLEQCAADEAKARDELQPLWAQFGPHDKAVCIEETSMDGTPIMSSC